MANNGFQNSENEYKRQVAAAVGVIGFSAWPSVGGIYIAGISGQRSAPFALRAVPIADNGVGQLRSEDWASCLFWLEREYEG
ncbi:hypothetical protein [Marinobacter sp.]|uniref:hypothetical protein n=1 Tax=Marinobacter sp. TaxID=50741 RepID=UPI002357DD81|nr:hypothetical protein [Marinobacter sp.]